MGGGGGGEDGGGPWELVSKGRGYDFDVCARLENSIITPSLIFLNFSPKFQSLMTVHGCFIA